MHEIIRFAVGLVILFLGIPLGNLLAKWTKEELKSGQKWFKLIILLCIIGVVIALFSGNDALLFTFLFIAVVTSRSLIKKSGKKKQRKKRK